MVEKSKKLSMRQMEEFAKKATWNALASYPAPPKNEQEKWVLGKYETDMEGIFEIYIPAEKVEDATIISCAKVNRTTGAVTVEVFLSQINQDGS